MPSNPIPTDDIARHSAETKASGKRNVALWIVQAVLALVFVFAGAAKLVLATETLAKQAPLPVAFLRFIGVCEVLGALGLILPGALNIKRGLTALAAAGLVVIMVGATITTLVTGGGATAVVPVIVGILAAVVANGRRRWVAPGR
ncbi:MAG: DoxX family protein [Deltaproteobacteria bacterium]|nr:MAG: DoxX family protein [Deltaproteobacteria bacterium]